jgi:hypothetical protein
MACQAPLELNESFAPIRAQEDAKVAGAQRSKLLFIETKRPARKHDRPSPLLGENRSAECFEKSNTVLVVGGWLEPHRLERRMLRARVGVSSPSRQRQARELILVGRCLQRDRRERKRVGGVTESVAVGVSRFRIGCDLLLVEVGETVSVRVFGDVLQGDRDRKYFRPSKLLGLAELVAASRNLFELDRNTRVWRAAASARSWRKSQLLQAVP